MILPIEINARRKSASNKFMQVFQKHLRMIEDDLYDLVASILPEHRVFVNVKPFDAKFMDVIVKTNKPIDNDHVKALAEQFGVNQSAVLVSKNQLLIRATTT